MQAEDSFQKSLTLYKELKDEEHIAESLEALGTVAIDRGDATQASSFLEQSLAVAQKSGSTAVIPSILNGLAIIAFEGRDLERAQRLWGEALTLSSERGDVFGAASALMLMGYAELVRGDHGQATALLQEALGLYREIGVKINEARCLRGPGLAATLQDNPQQAKTLLEESLGIFRELGSKADIAENLDALAVTAGALGEDARAARLWGAAEGVREALDAPWGPTEHLLYEPRLAVARARVDEVVWATEWTSGPSCGAVACCSDCPRQAVTLARPVASTTMLDPGVPASQTRFPLSGLGVNAILPPQKTKAATERGDGYDRL